MIARKFAQDLLSTKPPEATVLLAAEGASRRVVDSMVIHMSHSGLNSQREPRTTVAHGEDARTISEWINGISLNLVPWSS